MPNATRGQGCEATRTARRVFRPARRARPTSPAGNCCPPKTRAFVDHVTEAFREQNLERRFSANGKPPTRRLGPREQAAH